MTPTDRRPAELLDLDRYVGAVFTEDAYAVLQEHFIAVYRERVAAEERAAQRIAQDRQQRRAQRRAAWLIAGCLAVTLLMAAFMGYFWHRGD